MVNWRVLAVVSILVPLGALDAQTIRGRVLDETNRLSAASAGVTLHDPAGTILTSAITDSVGRYALNTPGPGRYQLRVEGLGPIRLPDHTGVVVSTWTTTGDRTS